MVRPTIHRVRQGECLSSIARHYGLKDGETLLEQQPDDFRDSRTANILLPGDRVEVPAVRERQESVAVDGAHRMKLQRERTMLRLTVGDAEVDQTWGYELHIGEEVHTGTADGNAVIEHRVPTSLREATLITWPDDEGSSPAEATHVTTWTLQLGHLDPASELSGLRQRLANLGLYHGEIGEPGGDTDALDAATSAALRHAQTRLGLEPTGEYDEDTQTKLRELHDEE